jgi:hypothetical protein
MLRHWTQLGDALVMIAPHPERCLLRNDVVEKDQVDSISLGST